MITQPPRITLSRRQLLAAGGATAVTAAAGCSTVIDFIADRILEEVNVFNETGQRVSGAVRVVDPAGETALDETFDLDPSDDDDDDDEDSESLAVYDDVWGEAGSYEVSVELDAEIDGTSRATETVSIDDPDEDRLGVPLGAEGVDAAIGFRVGESLTDFHDGD